jgi:transposase-like protein
MVIKVLECPSCGSDQVIRHGKGPKGVQRYRCRACARTFRENPGTRAYSEQKKREILAAYQERTSLRGLTRIFGVSRTTVTAWLKKS